MKKTILLIEDNQEVRENTAEILELSDYHVITAENGKVGVELARRELPDLIICDVMMPELDGFGVLHVLSKNITTASIPFIFLTAKAEREDLRKGMNLGADDYLTRPFDDVQLLDAIEIRLKKSEHRKNPGSRNESQGLKELDQLLSVEKRVSHVAKKQIIYSQGSYPNFLYYVRSGKIKTARADKMGNEFITGLFREGDFVGYIELIENIPYNESAVALEEASVCAIPADDFFALLHSNRDVAGKFIRLLSGNVVEKEERLLKLAYCSVRKRVAEALILLQQKYRQETDENFTMAISRDDLSGIVGASKETVIRTLTDFKEEGLIAIAGSKITLLNEERLKSLKH